MFIEKPTKIMAIVTAFLFGLGVFLYMLLSLGNIISIYKVSPFSFSQFAVDASFMLMLFFSSATGFYVARDLMQSLEEKIMPYINKDTWLFSSGAFFFIAVVSLIYLTGVLQQIFFQTFSPLQADNQQILANLLTWSFMVMLGLTIAKISLNMGLELELFERATPHILRKLRVKRRGAKNKRR